MESKELVSSGELTLPTFSLTKKGEEWIDESLAGCALIGRVSNEIENSRAVASAQELKAVINALEKSRVDLTAPALKFQRECKAFFDGKAEELRKELQRVTRLCGDYASLQISKRRAEENARNEELSRLEREKQQALAVAQTHEARDAVVEHYDSRAKVEGEAPAPLVVAKGQSVAGDLTITVTDIWALAKAYPSVVNPPTIRLTEAKALIKAGVKLPGCTWEESVKVGIRAARPGKPIDV